jgi:hypothetical protein
MSNISIVTAFFDIGRGQWLEKRPLPEYLHRTTDTYFDRFAHLAKLENDMTIFTSEELAPAARALRGNRPTSIVTIDFHSCFCKLRNKIATIQNDPEYKSKISPQQIHNPEYWNPDYVLVNALKSKFACTAIDMEATQNELVAWLDFGYCRDERTLNGVKTWSYPFNPEKIHLFTVQDYDGTDHLSIIANNLVYVTGPCIVAGKRLWKELDRLFFHNMNELMANNLIDDDQSILLKSWLTQPDLFEIHPTQNWFVAFKDFNALVH